MVLECLVGLAAVASQPTLSVPELVVRLTSKAPAERADAAWALASAGNVERVVIDALLEALGDVEERVRENATWALWHVRNPDFARETLFDVRPRVRSVKRPRYPPAAFQQKVEGDVVVRLLVGAGGRVIHAEVVKSIPELDAAALESIRGGVFSPAIRGGRPVPGVVEEVVKYRIY